MQSVLYSLKDMILEDLKLCSHKSEEKLRKEFEQYFDERRVNS